MTISKNNLKSLTIGIRFQKSFRIGDIIGHIFDDVLHGKSSPFDTKFFTGYQELSSNDKILINNESGDFLRITISDIIFRYVLRDPEKTLVAELDWFKKNACLYILNEICAIKNISDIIRAGLMFTHVTKATDIGSSVLKRLKGNEIQNTDQFSLSFGNKDTTTEAMIRKEVEDYLNRIYTFKQISADEYDMTLDYQYYFKPLLDNIKDWSFEKYFDGATDYLNNKYYATANAIIFGTEK